MIALRVAEQRDARAIAQVHVASWRTTYAGIVTDDYLKSLHEEDRVLLWQDWLTREIETYVSEVDGEVVGFASAGPVREPLESCDAELYAIYLLDRAQRCGHGTALLQALAESLCSKGFRAVVVWVLAQNPAKHFYERSGASYSSTKQIEIGDVLLEEIAFKWPDLTQLVPLVHAQPKIKL